MEVEEGHLFDTSLTPPEFEFFADGDLAPDPEEEVPPPHRGGDVASAATEVEEEAAQQGRKRRKQQHPPTIPMKAMWQVLFDMGCKEGMGLQGRFVAVVRIDEDEGDRVLALPAALATALFPHQKRAVRMAWRACFARTGRKQDECPDREHPSALCGNLLPAAGCIIAHEVGTGKTFTTIATLALFHLANRQYRALASSDGPILGHSLIIVPTSLIKTWQDQWVSWLTNTNLKSAFGGQDKRRANETDRIYSGLYRVNRGGFERWARCGGCLIASYAQIRYLVNSQLGEGEDDEGEEEEEEEEEEEDDAAKNDINIAKLLSLPTLVVFDEGHMLQGHQTRRVMEQFATPGKIVLTGTPIQNRLQELWTLVDFVRPGFMTKGFFASLEGQVRKGRNTDDPSEALVAKQLGFLLNAYLKPFLDRRRCRKLLSRVPMVRDYIVMVPLTLRQLRVHARVSAWATSRMRYGGFLSLVSTLMRLMVDPGLVGKESQPAKEEPGGEEEGLEDPSAPYRRELADLLAAVPDDADPDPVADPMFSKQQLVGARRASAAAKGFASCKTFAASRIISSSAARGEKVLVFSTWISPLERTLRDVRSNTPHIRSCLLTGRLSVQARAHMIKEFDQGAFDVMFLTIGCGGVGLNLQKASRVVLLDPGWNPQRMVQAIARSHRLGQTQQVEAFRLTARGSLEEEVTKACMSKEWMKRCGYDGRSVIRQRFTDDCTSVAEFVRLDLLNAPATTAEKAKNELLRSQSAYLSDLLESGASSRVMRWESFFVEGQPLTAEQKRNVLKSGWLPREGCGYGLPRMLPYDTPEDLEEASDGEEEETTPVEQATRACQLEERKLADYTPVSVPIKQEIEQAEEAGSLDCLTDVIKAKKLPRPRKRAVTTVVSPPASESSKAVPRPTVQPASSPLVKSASSPQKAPVSDYFQFDATDSEEAVSTSLGDRTAASTAPTSPTLKGQSQPPPPLPPSSPPPMPAPPLPLVPHAPALSQALQVLQKHERQLQEQQRETVRLRELLEGLVRQQNEGLQQQEQEQQQLQQEQKHKPVSSRRPRPRQVPPATPVPPPPPGYIGGWYSRSMLSTLDLHLAVSESQALLSDYVCSLPEKKF